MLEDLKGRRTLLTGASRGLGTHVARGLAKEGVELVLGHVRSICGTPQEQQRVHVELVGDVRIAWMDARNALAFYNRGLSYWDRREFDKALADTAGDGGGGGGCTSDCDQRSRIVAMSFCEPRS